MKEPLAVLRYPLALYLLAKVLGMAMDTFGVREGLGFYAWVSLVSLLYIVALVWAGYELGSKSGQTYLKLCLFSLVLPIAGGIFQSTVYLFQYLAGGSQEDLLAFYGASFSTAIFLPADMILALLGGYWGKQRGLRSAHQP